MERIPKPGEFYRHFKNKLYQVIAVAEHTETGEELVVYQALYGSYRVYARPLTMFNGRVDREKYPDISQEYRFQFVFPEESDTWEGDRSADRSKLQEDLPSPNPLLVDFLDAESCEARIEVLLKMRGKVGQGELDSIYVVLDLEPDTGSIEKQLDGIRRHLELKNRYDGLRLR